MFHKIVNLTDGVEATNKWINVCIFSKCWKMQKIYLKRFIRDVEKSYVFLRKNVFIITIIKINPYIYIFTQKVHILYVFYIDLSTYLNALYWFNKTQLPLICRQPFHTLVANHLVHSAEERNKSERNGEVKHRVLPARKKRIISDLGIAFILMR